MSRKLKVNPYSDATNGIFLDDESRVDGSKSAGFYNDYSQVGRHVGASLDQRHRALKYGDGFIGTEAEKTNLGLKRYTGSHDTSAPYYPSFLELDSSSEISSFSLGSQCRDGSDGMTFAAWVKLPAWGSGCWERNFQRPHIWTGEEGNNDNYTSLEALQDFPVIYKGFADICGRVPGNIFAPNHGCLVEFNPNLTGYDEDCSDFSNWQSYANQSFGHTEYCLGFTLMHVSQLRFTDSHCPDIYDNRYGRKVDDRVYDYTATSLWTNDYASGWVLVPYFDVGYELRDFSTNQTNRLMVAWKRHLRDNQFYSHERTVRAFGPTVAPFTWFQYGDPNIPNDEGSRNAAELTRVSIDNGSLISADPALLANRWVFISATVSAGGQVKVFFEPGQVTDSNKRMGAHTPLSLDKADPENANQTRRTSGARGSNVGSRNGLFGGVAASYNDENGVRDYGDNAAHKSVHVGRQLFTKCVSGASHAFNSYAGNVIDEGIKLIRILNPATGRYYYPSTGHLSMNAYDPAARPERGQSKWLLPKRPGVPALAQAAGGFTSKYGPPLDIVFDKGTDGPSWNNVDRPGKYLWAESVTTMEKTRINPGGPWWGPDGAWFYWSPNGQADYTYENTTSFENYTYTFTPRLGHFDWSSSGSNTKGREYIRLWDPTKPTSEHTNERVSILAKIAEKYWEKMPTLCKFRIGVRPNYAEYDAGNEDPSDGEDHIKIWRQFAGKIDEVTVWNRALSNSEMLEVYNLAANDDKYGRAQKTLNKNLGQSSSSSLKQNIIASWSFDSNLTDTNSLVDPPVAPAAPSGLSVGITASIEPQTGENGVEVSVSDYYLDLSWTNNAAVADFSGLQVQIIDPDKAVFTETNSVTWYDMDGKATGKKAGQSWVSLPPGIVAQEGWESSAQNIRDERVANSVKGIFRQSCDNTHSSLRIIMFPELHEVWPDRGRVDRNYNSGEKFRVRVRAVNRDALNYGDQFFSDWSNVVTVTVPNGNTSTSTDWCDDNDTQHVSNDLTPVNITQSTTDKKHGTASASLYDTDSVNKNWGDRPNSTAHTNYNLFNNTTSCDLSTSSYLYDTLSADSAERCSFRPDVDFIISGWFKLNSSDTVQTLVAKWDHTDESKQEWALRVDPANDQFITQFKSKPYGPDYSTVSTNPNYSYHPNRGDVSMIKWNAEPGNNNTVVGVWYHICMKVKYSIVFSNGVLWKKAQVSLFKNSRKQFPTSGEFEYGLEQNIFPTIGNDSSVDVDDIFSQWLWERCRVNTDSATQKFSVINFSPDNKLIFGLTPGKVVVDGSYLKSNTEFGFEQFDGKLDSWGYWSGPMTSSHWSTHQTTAYNSGAGLDFEDLTTTLKQGGLVAFWRFDESSGDRLDATTAPPPAVPTPYNHRLSAYLQQNYLLAMPMTISGALAPPEPIKSSSNLGGLFLTGKGFASTNSRANSDHWPSGLGMRIRTNATLSDGSAPAIPLHVSGPVLPTKSLDLTISLATATGASGVQDSMFITLPKVYDPNNDIGTWEIDPNTEDAVPAYSGGRDLFLAGPSIGKIPNFTIDGTPILISGVVHEDANTGAFPLSLRTLYMKGTLGTPKSSMFSLFAQASLPSGTLPLYIKMKPISTDNVSNYLDDLAKRTWGYVPSTGAIPLFMARSGADSTANRMGVYIHGVRNLGSGNMPMFMKNEDNTNSMKMVVHNFTSNKDLKITMEA